MLPQLIQFAVDEKQRFDPPFGALRLLRRFSIVLNPRIRFIERLSQQAHLLVGAFDTLERVRTLFSHPWIPANVERPTHDFGYRYRRNVIVEWLSR